MDRDRAEAVLDHIGANVQRLRARRGMTQEALAEAADISPRLLQRLERGKSNLGVVVLVRLAAALGVPPAVLLRPAALPEAKRGRPRKASAKARAHGPRGPTSP